MSHDTTLNATPQDSWSRSSSTDSSSSANTDETDTSTDNDDTDTNNNDASTIERNEVTPDVMGGTNFPDFDEYIDLGVIQANYSTRTLDDGTERPTIHLFCRDPESNEPIHIKVYNFKPYFYIPAAERDQINERSDNIRGTETNHTSIRNDDVVRVYTDVPRSVGYLRDEVDKHYEADVQFPDRFLIDKDINSGIRIPARWVDDDHTTIKIDHTEIEPVDVNITPRIHTVDIEVDDRNGFPEADDADEEIISISSHDSYTDDYMVWLLDPGTDADIPTDLPDYDFVSDGDHSATVRVFDTEAQMMADYISYIDSTNPDILTGWNFDDFDAPYIVNRLDYLDNTSERDVASERLSRIGEIWGGGWRGPNIKGRVVMDLLEAYKRTQFSELDSYRLDAIGEIELGVGKEIFDGNIGDLWENNPERLLEYNLRDVEICVELDRKQEIFSFWDEVRQFVGCRIQDAPIPGDAVDMYVLQKVNGKFALPSKGHVETGEDYEGGAVFDPITGMREMVTVLDLKSLYPMCMRTVNASPETKVDPDEYDGETYVTPNDIHYRKDQDGIIREMVDELLSEREKKKEKRSQYEPGDEKYEIFDRQQAAVKVIMNSLYGTLGWEQFRLYDKDNASAVTAVGREVIEFTERVVEDMGSQVTYGDTDSVMLELGGDHSKEEAIERSFDIEDEINDRYDTFAAETLNADEHFFEIEFEKLYKRFLQAGKKKRYAGHIIWKEGDDVDDIDITGFEYKRSDIAPITKEVQKNLIEMLVTGEDLDDVRTYIQGVIEDFKNGEYEYEEIGIPSGIGQELNEYDTETAHVRGAKYANVLLGTRFGKGSKPQRLYLERVQPDFYQRVEEEHGLDPNTNDIYAQFKRNPDVICFIHNEQVPDEFEADLDKMMNKTLRGPISRVLEAVDINWESIKSGQKQTGLENYF